MGQVHALRFKAALSADERDGTRPFKGLHEQAVLRKQVPNVFWRCVRRFDQDYLSTEPLNMLRFACNIKQFDRGHLRICTLRRS